MSLVVQCPNCRTLVVAVAIEVEGARAGMRCAACATMAWLPVTTAGAPAVALLTEPAAGLTISQPLALRGMSDPALPMALASSMTTSALERGDTNKLVTTAPQRPVHMPGALASRVAPKLVRLPQPTAEQRLLEAGFSQLLDRWELPDEHKSLLQRASMAGELGFLGQRYRAVLDAVPDDPHAKKAQAEILVLAMAQMKSSPEMTSDGGASRARTILIGVVSIGFVAALLTLGGQLMRNGMSMGARPAAPSAEDTWR